MATQRVLTFGEGHELRTDLVFFATGRAPATTGLGLDKAGVTLNGAGAVVVDQHLRTSRAISMRWAMSPTG